MNLLRVELRQEAMANLGDPMYLMTILGVAKILGVIALLAPRLPLLKEWAYAGFTFDDELILKQVSMFNGREFASVA